MMAKEKFVFCKPQVKFARMEVGMEGNKLPEVYQAVAK